MRSWDAGRRCAPAWETRPCARRTARTLCAVLVACGATGGKRGQLDRWPRRVWWHEAGGKRQPDTPPRPAGRYFERRDPALHQMYTSGTTGGRPKASLPHHPADTMTQVLPSHATSGLSNLKPGHRTSTFLGLGAADIRPFGSPAQANPYKNVYEGPLPTGHLDHVRRARRHPADQTAWWKIIEEFKSCDPFYKNRGQPHHPHAD